MPLRAKIRKATGWLLSFQNDDGGIPSIQPGRESGSWTTADTLEAVLSSGVVATSSIKKVKKMVDFLIAAQVGNSGSKSDSTTIQTDAGGWPLFREKDCSAMATGHAVAALILAENFLDDDRRRSKRTREAIAQGFIWLETNQNRKDGGWGTHPQSGEESNVIATFYSLFPYYRNGTTFENSAVVRRAVEFLLNAMNEDDGSWGRSKGVRGDVCNTARAITGLIRAGYCKPDDLISKKAVKFILRRQLPDGGLWDIETEGFFHKDAPGQLVYNQNAMCDVLTAFVETEYFETETHAALTWLLRSQDECGSWHLSSPSRKVDEISTWSTAEWIFAVDLASKKYLGHTLSVYDPQIRPRNFSLLAPVIAIAILSPLISFKPWISVLDFWKSIPDARRTFIYLYVSLPLGLSITSGLLIEYLYRGTGRKLFARAGYFLRRENRSNRTN